MFNIKKKICIIVGIVIVLTLLFSGCVANASSAPEKNNQFTVIDSGRQYPPGISFTYTIIKHNETGVCYIVMFNGNQGGISIMLNADGTPYIG
jgi:hypothetical protein